MKPHRFALAAVGALFLSACQLPHFVPSKMEVARRAILVQPVESSHPPLFVWHGSDQPGSVNVTIDLSDQKAYIFKNRQNIGWSYVATGRSGFRTPTGTFVISEKVVNKRSNRYGSIVDARGNVVKSNAVAGVHRVPAGGKFLGAKMPYWMRLTNYGVGMHAGPIPHPGSPASHGCIRLPYAFAQQIYDEAPSGTRVTIVQ